MTVAIALLVLVVVLFSLGGTGRCGLSGHSDEDY